MSGSGDPLSSRSIAALLARTLGQEKSEEVVGTALRRLGLRPGPLTPLEGRAVLDNLGAEPGIVGVTARFARSRSGIESDPPPASMVSSALRPAAAPPTNAPPPPATRLVNDIVSLFAATMGHEKGEETVLAAVKRLGLPRDRLDKPQCTQLFEDLGRQPGLVGVTARFARARLSLQVELQAVDGKR